jgi:hypothetical protein
MPLGSAWRMVKLTISSYTTGVCSIAACSQQVTSWVTQGPPHSFALCISLFKLSVLPSALSPVWAVHTAHCPCFYICGFARGLMNRNTCYVGFFAWCFRMSDPKLGLMLTARLVFRRYKKDLFESPRLQHACHDGSTCIKPTWAGTAAAPAGWWHV